MPEDNFNLLDCFSFSFGKKVNDDFKLESNVIISLFDSNGILKERIETHNTVTTAGKVGVMDQILAAPTLPKMGWMAIGTGSPAATLLGAENARVAFTSK